MSVEVKSRKGEPVEKMLRRLKKKLDREDVIVTARNNRYFVPPSIKKQLKKKKLAFQNMLRLRYQDM